MRGIFKRSALRRAEILAYVIARAKKIAVLESRKIARVAYSGQITIIGSGRRENYKRSDLGRTGILVWAIAHAKKVAISE